MKYAINIPYISQHWKKSCSAEQLDAYDDDFIALWSHRSCGLACVLMIMNHIGDYHISLIDLFNEAVESDFYTPKGWLHSGLADLLKRRNIQAIAKGIPQKDIINGLSNGKIYIVSITYKFPDDGRKGGHLAIACGFDGHFVYFKDPSSWGETHFMLPPNEFFSSYSGRCIEVDDNVFQVK